jgi:hypothetical protein
MYGRMGQMTVRLQRSGCHEEFKQRSIETVVASPQTIWQRLNKADYSKSREFDDNDQQDFYSSISRQWHKTRSRQFCWRNALV